ncbi:MAG: magnesium chelatase subunit D, partial [Pseudomonadota bacterium]
MSALASLGAGGGADGQQSPRLEAGARGRQIWGDALLCLRMVALAPRAFGGLWLRAPHGPVRDAFLGAARRILSEGRAWRRLPGRIDEAGLVGGLDASESLAAGRLIRRRGLLAEADGGVVLASMAERLSAGTAATLARALDTGVAAPLDGGPSARARFLLLALDESEGDEPPLPAALQERLAFPIDLRGVAWADVDTADAATEPLGCAEVCALENVHQSEAHLAACSEAGLLMGVEGLRSVGFARRAALALAALDGRDETADEDVATAVRLTLAPRARFFPADPEGDPEADDASGPAPEPEGPPDTPAEPDAADPPPDQDDPDASQSEQELSAEALAEMAVAAAMAAAPPGVLDALRTPTGAPAQARRGNERRGEGREEKNAARGRPAGSRPGRLEAGARLDLTATLAAAAPWQKLRGREAGERPDAGRRLKFRTEDFRIRRFRKRKETTLIFCVDASGSSALQRLGEAKGAVELLLAEAYVARTHVGLVAFRGEGAEILLPPTRSLARAKAALATLPGGGGTPLAAGLETARLLAEAERRRGRDPLIVVLTDGRANVSSEASGDRAAAEAEAEAACAAIAELGLPSVWIDTAPRKRPEGPRLAA